MSKLLIIALLLGGLYYFTTRPPSTDSIVQGMGFGEQVSYKGQTYSSEWTKQAETIKGDLRRKDRHYDENIPVITYSLVVTTGDYSDPEKVKVQSRGGGNYYWSSKINPQGTIVFYHAVPDSAAAQSKIDAIREGDPVEILAKVSKNSEIKADNGAFVQLMHGNHKFILVEDIL